MCEREGRKGRKNNKIGINRSKKKENIQIEWVTERKYVKELHSKERKRYTATLCVWKIEEQWVIKKGGAERKKKEKRKDRINRKWKEREAMLNNNGKKKERKKSHQKYSSKKIKWKKGWKKNNKKIRSIKKERTQIDRNKECAPSFSLYIYLERERERKIRILKERTELWRNNKLVKIIEKNKDEKRSKQWRKKWS